MRLTLVRLRGEGPARELPVMEQFAASTRLDGWARATGDAVAFLDDRYDPGPAWLDAIQDGVPAGGAVLPAETLGYAGWLFYVVEYGWQRRLAAGNIAYPRSAGPTAELEPGPARLDPRMDVTLARAPGFLEYAVERFGYSRAWASGRLTRFASLPRIALPILICARVPWWRKPLTFPGVLVLSFVMAAGEIAGAWSRRSVTLEDS